MLNQNLNITDFIRFVSSVKSAEIEPVQQNVHDGGIYCDNVDRGLQYNNNNNTFTGGNLKMQKSSGAKRKTSARPVQLSSLGPVGEVPERSVQK
jgi:hypothetical protein